PGDDALVDELRLAAPDDGDRATGGVEPDGRVAVAILRPDRGIEAPCHARCGLLHLAQRAARDVVDGIQVLAALRRQEAIAGERARHIGVDPVGPHRRVLAAGRAATPAPALL